MVLEAIIPTTISILTPLVKEGVEAATDRFGRAAVTKAQGLLTRLKTRWSADPVAQDAVERFEKDADLYETHFRNILAERLESDSDLARELQLLLEDADLTVFQQVDEVSGSAEVTAVKVSGDSIPSDISIVQEVGEVKDNANVIGLDLTGKQNQD